MAERNHGNSFSELFERRYFLVEALFYTSRMKLENAKLRRWFSGMFFQEFLRRLRAQSENLENQAVCREENLGAGTYDLKGSSILLVRRFEMGFSKQMVRDRGTTRRLLLQSQFFEQVAVEKGVDTIHCLKSQEPIFWKMFAAFAYTMDSDRQHVVRNTGQYVAQNYDVWVLCHFLEAAGNATPLFWTLSVLSCSVWRVCGNLCAWCLRTSPVVSGSVLQIRQAIVSYLDETLAKKRVVAFGWHFKFLNCVCFALWIFQVVGFSLAGLEAAPGSSGLRFGMREAAPC